MLGSMPSITLARLSDHELQQTAQLLGAAFADNPCYAYIHPRRRTRAADLVRFFGRNLRWRLPLDLTWVARDDAGTVLGTVSLEPPGGVSRPVRDMFTHWILPSLGRPGLRSLARLVRVDASFAEQNRIAAGSARYWHVHAVAVDPRRHGQRVGTRMMAATLDVLRTELRGDEAPVVLSTQRKRNVAFYAQLGFALSQRADDDADVEGAGLPLLVHASSRVAMHARVGAAGAPRSILAQLTRAVSSKPPDSLRASTPDVPSQRTEPSASE
jgi:GNAT superfamily N-acetyltransferase